MPIHRFHFESCDQTIPHGTQIEVEVQEYPGYSVDEIRLRQWCEGILVEYFENRLGRLELLEEGVHARISTSTGNVLVDTISNRKPEAN